MIKNAIKCPSCGREYLPGEIYLPKHFLGQPENIIKDEKGQVLGNDGINPDTTETYICDHCGKKFKVDAVITFKTEIVRGVFDD